MAVSFWDKVAGIFGGKRPEYYEQRRRQRKQNKGKEQTSLVGQGLGDIFDRYGNMGADENGVRTSAGNSRGDSFNNTQLAEMQYNHDEAQLDRQWQEDMYRKYQSPEAQMRQYDAAGLNRALAYNGGVDVNGPSGGSAASADVAASGESPVSGFQSAMGVMSTVMEMLLGGSNLATSLKSISNQSKSIQNEIDKTAHDNALTDANTESVKVETNNKILDGEIKKIDLAYKRQFYDLDIEEQRERIANLKKQGQKILSDISVNNSVIELNGAQIDLTHGLKDKADKECALVTSQTLLTNLEAEKIQKVMPYIEAKERAELALTYATTEQQKAAAQKELAQAGEAVMAAAREQKIIDSGYYDERVKTMKADRKMAIANCIVGNICDVAKTAVGVYTGTAAFARTGERKPISAPETPKPNVLVDASGNVLYSPRK